MKERIYPLAIQYANSGLKREPSDEIKAELYARLVSAHLRLYTLDEENRASLDPLEIKNGTDALIEAIVNMDEDTKKARNEGIENNRAYKVPYAKYELNPKVSILDSWLFLGQSLIALENIDHASAIDKVSEMTSSSDRDIRNASNKLFDLLNQDFKSKFNKK